MNKTVSRRAAFSLLLSILCLLYNPLEASVEKIQEKLGTADWAVLQAPQYVTILLIDPNEKLDLLKKEIHLSAPEIERLKRNILEDHNYDFERVKRCRFVPDLSFKFEDKEGNVVYFFVDRNCLQVLFKSNSRALLVNYDRVHERLNFFLQQLLDGALARGALNVRDQRGRE